MTGVLVIYASEKQLVNLSGVEGVDRDLPGTECLNVFDGLFVVDDFKALSEYLTRRKTMLSCSLDFEQTFLRAST